jgi:hypothetical protein
MHREEAEQPHAREIAEQHAGSKGGDNRANQHDRIQRIYHRTIPETETSVTCTNRSGYYHATPTTILHRIDPAF